MNTLLVVAVVASQPTYYEAKVTTFGCNSIEEVHALQEVRTDRRTFQMELVKKQFQGQCVAIEKGTVVEGSIERASEPPGRSARL